MILVGFMLKDYSKEVKKLIKEFSKKGFEFGKPIKLLSFENNLTEEEMKEEILNCKDLEFTAKQSIRGEIRYALYFVYSNSRGRVYVLTFRDRIRVITIFPLGRTTLRKYQRKKFKNDKSLKEI